MVYSPTAFGRGKANGQPLETRTQFAGASPVLPAEILFILIIL